MGFKYAMILDDLNVWQCIKCVCTHAPNTNLVRHKGFSKYNRLHTRGRHDKRADEWAVAAKQLIS